MTNQPQWKRIANLGDANPIDHGGYFVFEDTTGVYPPEAELLEVPEDEDGEYTIYRFILEKCTYQNGVLSDNSFHPDHSAWFATEEKLKETRPQDTTYLSGVCSSMDIEESELIRLFCSDNPIERAEAYRCIGLYHGFDNLDSYPLVLNREETEKRYEEK